MLLTGFLLSVAPAQAQPSCAQTADPAAPAAPTPGNACWTDVQPYPFGIDGNPVSATLIASQCTGGDFQCYLQVTSFAFRAWNRGLAATTPTAGGQPSPYGVWLYNGSRWYPDPTFPGSSTCPGSKILWAGKLDYWLIGPPTNGTPPGSQPWPTLCRFDGANYQWEPLSVPAATKIGHPTGTITAGSCFAWNDCWFFGTGGAVLHWDGNALTDESVGLGASAWLDGDYADAIAASGASGPAGLAVGDANASKQPGGTAPPQVSASTGGPFTPLPLDPSTLGGGPTNLVAVSSDSQGDLWVAADPNLLSVLPGAATVNLFPDPNSTQVQASPVFPVSLQGSQVSCPTTPNTNGFSFPYVANGSKTSYLWSSVAAVPDGSFIAGGAVGSIPSGQSPVSEPVLAQASCSNPTHVTATLFRIPDPANPSDGKLVQADAGGYITAVAASAFNDAWAASSTGPNLVTTLTNFTEPPHLYQLTDGQPPDAPAGDDNESRPAITQQEPTLFVIAPPVVVPSPPTTTTTVTTTQRSTTRKVRLKSAVYDIAKTPKLESLSNGSFRLSIGFKVRRKVTIGLDALYHGRVVSKSGLKTFTGHTGTLAVTVTRKRWPTGLKFVEPGTHG